MLFIEQVEAEIEAAGLDDAVAILLLACLVLLPMGLVARAFRHRPTDTPVRILEMGWEGVDSESPRDIGGAGGNRGGRLAGGAGRVHGLIGASAICRPYDPTIGAAPSLSAEPEATGGNEFTSGSAIATSGVGGTTAGRRNERPRLAITSRLVSQIEV